MLKLCILATLFVMRNENLMVHVDVVVFESIL